MKKIFLSILIVFTIGTAEAQTVCSQVFESTSTILAKKSNIAAVEISTGNRQIPSILVNSGSIHELRPLLENSLGIVVAHQTDYNNDHGLMRLGNFFIDRDNPGARRNGELNLTGISWARVQGYVAYQAGRNSYNRIEVLFELSPNEMKVAQLYQRLRRAAIINPNFNFGGARNFNDFNMLKTCGEICFTFSTSSNISMVKKEIYSKLQERSSSDLENYLNSPSVQKFLADADLSLLNTDLNQLKPDLAMSLEVPEGFYTQFKIDQNAKQEVREFLNWLIGYSVANRYGVLIENLQIWNASDFSNFTSPRASSVLVYDSKATAEEFTNPNYQSKGVFSTWSHQNSKPIEKRAGNH